MDCGFQALNDRIGDYALFGPLAGQTGRSPDNSIGLRGSNCNRGKTDEPPVWSTHFARARRFIATAEWSASGSTTDPSKPKDIPRLMDPLF